MRRSDCTMRLSSREGWNVYPFWAREARTGSNLVTAVSTQNMRGIVIQDSFRKVQFVDLKQGLQVARLCWPVILTKNDCVTGHDSWPVMTKASSYLTTGSAPREKSSPPYDYNARKRHLQCEKFHKLLPSNSPTLFSSKMGHFDLKNSYFGLNWSHNLQILPSEFDRSWPWSQFYDRPSVWNRVTGHDHDHCKPCSNFL